MRGLVDALFLVLVAVAAWFWLRSRSDNTTADAIAADDAGAAADSSNSDGGSVASKFANAIFRFESGGDPNSKAVRNNNPGNLRPPNGDASYWQGQTGVDPTGGYAIFDSMDNGFRALNLTINANLRRTPGMTLTQFFAKFLGQSPNAPMITKEGNPFTYADAVAGWLGLTRDNTISEAASA